jgi:hypothetical protein
MRPRLLENLTLVSQEDVQIVCAYLQSMANIDQAEPALGQLLDGANCWALLRQHFLERAEIRTTAPSYAQLQVFVSVLAQQLRAFSMSSFFALWLLREGNHNAVRGVIIRCLVDAAARLATRTVGKSSGGAGNSAEQIEQRLRVQSFEETNYVLLLMQADGGLTPFPDPATLFRGAAPVDRYYRDPIHGSARPPDYRTLSQQDLFEELLKFLAVNARAEKLRASDQRRKYTLTADNVLKMMVIAACLRTVRPHNWQGHYTGRVILVFWESRISVFLIESQA